MRFEHLKKAGEPGRTNDKAAVDDCVSEIDRNERSSGQTDHLELADMHFGGRWLRAGGRAEVKFPHGRSHIAGVVE